MAAITIGNAATNQVGTSTINGVTRVDKCTPANGTGKITQIEMHVSTEITAGLQVAIFSASGDNLTTRSVVTLGSAAAGYNSFTVDSSAAAISMDVVAGDYIGAVATDGAIDMYTGASTGQWWKAGDNIPCSNATFALVANRKFSLLGTGSTTDSTHLRTLMGVGV